MDRIGRTGILGLLDVGVIDSGRVFVEIDVLYKRTEFNGVKDLRLILALQIHAFGIATTFEVENGIAIPTVLIVTDKFALWVCRKGGFSCSRKSEENGSIAILANICRAMHGKHIALVWKDVVQVQRRYLS
jgi:hypothetical protein